MPHNRCGLNASRTASPNAATDLKRESNKAELTEYRDMLVAIRGNVAKLKQQGRSLEDTITAKPTATFDAKWGQFVITPDLFTRLVYHGV